MYYNKNIKSLLFDFKSDVNYISILIIGILKGFECSNKRSSFKDFRKIRTVRKTGLFMNFADRKLCGLK